MLSIISATWDEIKYVKERISASETKKLEDLEYIRGEIDGKSLVLARTGIGIRKARKGASFIIQKFKPKLIVSAGHGGALSPDLKLGDIVIGEWVLSLKKNEKRSLATNLHGFENRYKTGGILTENRFISDPKEKKNLSDAAGVLCVDMETWGVAEAASQTETPVLSVRSISDDSGEIVPDIGSIYDSTGKLDNMKGLRYFASRPSLILPFIRFRYVNLRKSTDSLNHFLLSLIRHI